MFGIIMGKATRRRASKQPALIHASVPSSGKDTRMNWLTKLFYRVTGGRPMRRESSSSAFFDGPGQREVFYFRDRLRNVRYLANHKWSRFRVESTNQG